MYSRVCSPERKNKSDFQRIHRIQTSSFLIELKLPGSEQQDDHSGKLPAGLAYQSTATTIATIP